MNTVITLKGIPLIRSGYSKRGFTSAAIILAASHNSSNKIISVKYMGCRIGYINHIHYDNLPDGRVELWGDISFPLSSLIAQREILNNKDVYPVCIIETVSGANEVRLSEVILLTEEDREFDEQEPLNLSELRELFEDNVKAGVQESNTTNKICINKMYLNETDTLETKDGYLIINTYEATTTIKIETIEAVSSKSNYEGSNNISIYTASYRIEITNSNIDSKNIMGFIERYKESQLAALKIS
ncbi:hypothetical protein SNM20_004092 [Salmonella enterica]|nr:hypothetical protein [Salmonella enterica]